MLSEIYEELILTDSDLQSLAQAVVDEKPLLLRLSLKRGSFTDAWNQQPGAGWGWYVVFFFQYYYCMGFAQHRPCRGKEMGREGEKGREQ